MTDSVKAEARRDLTLWHPLYRDEAGLPPGKLEHAYVLTYGTCRAYDPLRGEDAAALVSPLKSQPMIELSLRTPLYVLRAGGRDRAIARRAFAADVPQEIIARKSKAHGTHKYRTILTRNVSVVRELLLDGFLVREGFLDPVKLEEVLSGQVSRIQSGTMELCIYLAIEAWVRGWRETRRENPSVLRSASARAQAI